MSESLNFLEQWNEAKMKISDLERKCEKYKRAADKVMNAKGTNSIKYGDITVKRKDIARSTLSKKDVPRDIWDRYCKATSYTAYYLTESL